MPRPDALPSPRHTVMRRFWRIFRFLSILSVVIAAIAVLLVARGYTTVHIHMLIATALGVGLMVLLGTALMSLTFFSSSSGHDDQAVSTIHEDDKE
jgi:uncharacterized membrane protein